VFFYQLCEKNNSKNLGLWKVKNLESFKLFKEFTTKTQVVIYGFCEKGLINIRMIMKMLGNFIKDTFRET
jgi:hypothetical protein